MENDSLAPEVCFGLKPDEPQGDFGRANAYRVMLTGGGGKLEKALVFRIM